MLRSGVWLWLGVAVPITIQAAPASHAYAQEMPAPRWAIALEVGGHTGPELYDQWVTRKVQPRDSLPLRTRWSERMEAAPILRLASRYRPEAAAGLYLASQYTAGATRAEFTGSAAPQSLERHASLWSIEGGVAMRLLHWANRRGSLEYLLGAAFVRTRIDLSGGHRDAFARTPQSTDTAKLDWSERDWSSWGLSLGIQARLPLHPAVAMRVSARDLVFPVNTTRLRRQEAEEVERLSGQGYLFEFQKFTSHHPSLSLGLEYRFSRGKPSALATLARPAASPVDNEAPRRPAPALAVQDTAAAITALRNALTEHPDDASAWRQLAILLSTRVEKDSAALEEAWQAVQLAIRAFPADQEVLAAYGRVHALLELEGRRFTPARPW